MKIKTTIVALVLLVTSSCGTTKNAKIVVGYDETKEMGELPI